MAISCISRSAVSVAEVNTMQENRPIENSGSELAVRREKLAALQAAGNDPF